MKRTIIIIGVLIIVIGIGALLYIFTRPGSSPSANPGQTGSLPNVPNQQLPTSTNGGSGPSSTSQQFGIVSNDPVIDYYVDGQNNATIVQPSGVIETVTNGQGTIISSSSIQGVTAASFSYDGKKVLVSYGAGSNPQSAVFDIATRAWTTLPQGMQSPAWSPYNYQIAYVTAGVNGTESISTFTVGSGAVHPSTITTMAIEDVTLQWPNKNTLVIADKPSAYAMGSAWFFNLTNKTLAPEITDYPAMEGIWSNTTGTTGLVFSGSSGNVGGDISLVTPAGTQQPITFVTLPSKCIFSEAAAAPSASGTIATSTPPGAPSLDLYCAVPRDQQTFFLAHLPDDYDQKMLFTSDDLYKMDTVTGSLTPVFSSQTQNFDAIDLKVFNDALFFINRYDHKLYGVALGQ